VDQLGLITLHQELQADIRVAAHACLLARQEGFSIPGAAL